MSLKSIIEFILHVDSFRNIDLCHQGFYYLKFRIYEESKGKKTIIHPYNIIEEPLKIYESPVLKASFDELTNAGLTKVFLIRYCEEEIPMNTMFQFRTEIDTYPKQIQGEIYMECELFFQSTLEKIKSNLKADFPKDLTGFELCTTFRCKINNIHKGIHEYIPIVFDDDNFCLINSSFHTILFDIKFRPDFDISAGSPLILDILDKKLSNIGSPSPSPLIKEKKKIIQAKQNFKSFKEFFDNITEHFNKENVENFYSFYMKILHNSFEKLSNHMDFMLTRMKIEDKKKFLEKFPPIELFQTTYNFMSSAGKNNIKGLTESCDLSILSNQDKIADEILNEFHKITGKIFETLYRFIDFIQFFHKSLNNLLKEFYHYQMKERWGESVFREKIKVIDFTQVNQEEVGKNHKSIADNMRKKPYYQHLDTLNIEDLNMFPKAEIHPIIFQEIYIKEDLKPFEMQKRRSHLNINEIKESSDPFHLFVLVHGFQGNSFDMRLFKNLLNVRYSNAHFICSSSNEDNTEGDIADMGKNLATEVKKYIVQWCPSAIPERISFIGHSLGGLIIRASLPYLKEYKDQFYTYLTLSTPHLGLIYGNSSLVDAGLWIFQRWKKLISLQQLSLIEVKNIEETYLYQLSTTEGLNWFNNIVLMGSYEDSYCPFESARIQISSKAFSKALNDPKIGNGYIKMSQNLLKNLKTDRVHRLDVNFNINSKNLDSFIGRAAHIQFLECHALFRMLVYTFDSFFK